MEQIDFLSWTNFRYVKKGKITNTEFKLICELHSKYFNHKYYEPCTCTGQKYRDWIKEIDNHITNNYINKN